MTADEVVGVVLIASVVVTLRGDLADWRARPGDARFDRAAWWPWGGATWVAVRRLSGVSAPAVACMGLFLLLGEPFWLACVLFGWVLVEGVVVLFGRPRFLIVPGLRDAPGLAPFLLRGVRGRGGDV